MGMKVKYFRTPAEIAHASDLKRGAHAVIASELRLGTLTRPDKCQKCRKPCRPHAHHDDYTKPRKVRFLCAGCHRAWHSKNTPKGYSNTFNVRLSPGVAEEIHKLSRKYDVSISNVINQTMSAAIASKTLRVTFSTGRRRF